MGNECMEIVGRWSGNNKVNFNDTKSQVLFVSRRPVELDVSIYLNNKKVKVLDELRYLGVIFDSRFSWSSQVRWITEKSLQLTNALSR